MLWGEESARKRIARARAKGTAKTGDLDREMKERKLKAGASQRNPLAAMKKEQGVVGATDMEFNPNFINGTGAGADGMPASLGDAVLSATKPPPQEMWSAFQQAFMVRPPRRYPSRLPCSGDICAHIKRRRAPAVIEPLWYPRPILPSLPPTNPSLCRPNSALSRRCRRR